MNNKRDYSSELTKRKRKKIDTVCFDRFRTPPKQNFFLMPLIWFLCFLLTRNVNEGMLGFEKFQLIELPQRWYCNMFTTYLGFPGPGFFSTDYFSLIPWFFLFVTGYFIYGIFKKKKWLNSTLLDWNCRPLSFVGRNTLFIYLIHQPVIYGILELCNM